jgi:hypothetical protein
LLTTPPSWRRAPDVRGEGDDDDTRLNTFAAVPVDWSTGMLQSDLEDILMDLVKIRRRKSMAALSVSTCIT